jgi:hypothetical protein
MPRDDIVIWLRKPQVRLDDDKPRRHRHRHYRRVSELIAILKTYSVS